MKAPSPLARKQIDRGTGGRLTGTAKTLLTPEQERAARDAFAEGGSRDDMARAAGVTVGLIRERLKDQLADLPKRGRGAPGMARRRGIAMPHPIEIAVECALIRQKWPPHRFGLVDELEEHDGNRFGRCREMPQRFHVHHGRMR